MGRIRTIKPEFFTHEDLFDAELDTGLPLRVAFAGLWCQADKAGRFKWRPRTLKSDVMPHDQVDFSRVLHALATRGFIVRYACRGEEFGYIPSWRKHQVINNRETESTLPDPSSGDCDIANIDNELTTRDPRDADASSTREGRVGHAGKAEGKGKEGKGKEGKEVCAAPSAPPTEPPSAESEPAKPKRRTTPRPINGDGDHQPATTTPGSEVWNAYADAYRSVYRVEPVRNADTNRWCKQLTQKVPVADAAPLAAWFVTHRNAYYIQRGHSLDALLRDVGKLHTEWQTGTQMTQAKARGVDLTASNPFLPLIAEARERERLESLENDKPSQP